MAGEETILYMRVPYPDESGEDWFAISATDQVQKDGQDFLIPTFHISPRPYSAAVAVDTCVFLIGGLDGDPPPPGQRTRRRSLREVSVIDTQHPQRGLFPGPPLRHPQTAMNCFPFCGRGHDVIYALPRLCSPYAPPEVLHCRRYPSLGNNDWRPMGGAAVAAVMNESASTVGAVEYREKIAINGLEVSIPCNLFFRSNHNGLLQYNLETNNNNNNPPLTIHDEEFVVPPLIGQSRGVCINGVIYFYVGFNGGLPVVRAYCLTLRRWYPDPGVIGFENHYLEFMLPDVDCNNRYPNPLVHLGKRVLCFGWVFDTDPFCVGVVKFKVKLRPNSDLVFLNLPYASVKSISHFKLRCPPTSLLDYLLVTGSGRMRLLNRLDNHGTKRELEMKEKRKLQTVIGELFTIPEEMEEQGEDEIH